MCGMRRIKKMKENDLEEAGGMKHKVDSKD